MKLGIIGTGWIVKDFLPELTNMEGLEIVSIMGSPQGFEKAQVLSEQYKIPNAVHDLDELCASGIDTVYVAVPNNLHFMYCRKALEKGMNVIVEKPMTDNAGEAENLAVLARKKKLFLFEAITTAYMTGYQKIGQAGPEPFLPVFQPLRQFQKGHYRAGFRSEEVRRCADGP